MADECFIELVDIVPLILELGGRQALYDFLNQVCDDEMCSVHGLKGISLPIIRASDLPLGAFYKRVRALVEESKL